MWAYRHFQSYDAELKRYFDSKPCEIVPDTESDPQGRVRLVFRQLVPIPDDIPLLIGDGIQNLRSSLDYLVCELVRTANHEPTKDHMFPICDGEVSFNSQLARHRLDNVPPDAVTIIKNLQPYHCGSQTSSAPIRVLDDLCNINKHQRICLACLAATSSETQFVSTAVGQSLQSTLGPRYHDAELAISHIPVSGEEMEVEGGAFFQVVIQERCAKGIEASTCVNALWGLVYKTILPAFERFFV